MPEFSNPFVAMNAPRKLTKDELVRTIRFNIAAEIESIQFYEQLHDSIDDELAKKVLLDIANEEKEHVGEFLHLLKYLRPDEESFYKEGEGEVEDMMKELKK